VADELCATFVNGTGEPQCMGEEWPLLSLEGVTYRHPVREPRRPWRFRPSAGIHSIDLDVDAGTILGLIGPNGAGKTTLMHTIAGLNPHRIGAIRIAGNRRRKSSWSNYQRRIGLMPERVNWSGNATPKQVLERLVTMRGEGDVAELLALVGLSGRADSKLDEMSQGMRQRLSLAAALLGNPEVLLLDEPMNGLDPVAQAAFRGMLRSLAERGVAIIVSSHNLNEMERLVDSVAILYRGQMVAAGRIGEVERALGCEQRLLVAGNGWVPPSAASFGRGVEMRHIEQKNDEEWRIELRTDSTWTPEARHNILDAIQTSGGRVHLIQTISPTLEELLAAATGEDPELVGLQVGGDAMIPVRTWEVSEDE
jgi:ABC-type multidrug transport system ATPase subunit